MFDDRPIGSLNSWRSAKIIGVILGVAALYFLLALGSLHLLSSVGLSTLLWPAAGLATGTTMAFGRGALPGVFLGAAAANTTWLLWAGIGGSTLWSTPLAIAVAAVAQAAVAAGLIARINRHSVGSNRSRRVLMTMFFMGPLSCTIAATIGTATQVLNDLVDPGQWAVVWFGWWLGDTLGSVLFSPFFAAVLASPNRVPPGRLLKVAAPPLFLGIVVLLALTQTLHAERRSAESARDAFAMDAVTILEANLTRHEEVLVGLRSLFEASPDVDSTGFRIYVDNFIARYPTLQAVSWNPIIANSELDDFIDAQRAQPGLEDFAVTERAPDGSLVTVGDRSEYVAVAYIEPIATNRAALGFDIASNPERLITIDTARSTGRITATKPITLVQGNSEQLGMLVLLPTYRAGFGTPTDVDGFMVGVYRLGDLMDSTFRAALWDGVDIELIDVTEDRAPLAVSPARRASSFNAIVGAIESATIEMEWFGRQWELVVTPVSGSLAQVHRSLPFEPLLALLVIVFLLESFVLILASDEQAAERRAEKLSYVATHDPLTGLLNRTGFADACDETEATSGERMLLFCDLDGFKAVNDTGGHDTGDALLRSVGNAMRSAVRTRDIVGRIGGDEFAVLLADCSIDAGRRVAQSLITKVSEAKVANQNGTFSVGVSVGLAVVGPDGVEVAMREADAASYAAKRAGGNTVHLAVASTLL
jgi:diguanylate cyclase (GGDEF)-like protein